MVGCSVARCVFVPVTQALAPQHRRDVHPCRLSYTRIAPRWIDLQGIGHAYWLSQRPRLRNRQTIQTHIPWKDSLHLVPPAHWSIPVVYESQAQTYLWCRNQMTKPTEGFI